MITKSKYAMDQPDNFLVNGLISSETNNEFLIAGKDHIHMVNDKTTTVKFICNYK